MNVSGTHRPVLRPPATRHNPVPVSPETDTELAAIDAFTHQALSRASATERRARRLVILFCAWLSLPIFGWLAGMTDPSIERTQRRSAAPFPELKVRWRGPVPVPRSASLAEWPSGFEAWFNDRWGFRRTAQQVYSATRLAGMVPTILDVPRGGGGGAATVIVGREGWLYYGGQNALESYRGADLFTPDELDAWAVTFQTRRDWLAKRGIPYVVMFAPDKSTIYPEYLPRSITHVGSTTRLDQMIARLSRMDGLHVVDPRAALLNAKRDGDVYSATDSHWNDAGAMVALHELENAARSVLRGREEQLHLPEMSPVKRWQGPATGDLAGLLDMPIPLVEEHAKLRFVREPKLRHVLAHRDERQVRWTLNEKPAALDRAVVIHDSFFVPLIPAFGACCRRVAYVSYRDFDPELIEREQPQLVVQEIVERSLLTLKPANESLEESLSRNSAVAQNKPPERN